MAKLPPQQTDLDIHAEVNGVDMGVLKDGTACDQHHGVTLGDTRCPGEPPSPEAPQNDACFSEGYEQGWDEALSLMGADESQMRRANEYKRKRKL
jgi:hypothetical protein